MCFCGILFPSLSEDVRCSENGFIAHEKFQIPVCAFLSNPSTPPPFFFSKHFKRTAGGTDTLRTCARFHGSFPRILFGYQPLFFRFSNYMEFLTCSAQGRSVLQGNFLLTNSQEKIHAVFGEVRTHNVQNLRRKSNPKNKRRLCEKYFFFVWNRKKRMKTTYLETSNLTYK